MQHASFARPLLALAVVTTLAVPALAGPPLVCRPFDIGSERSLPWNSNTNGWRGERASYDRSKLTGDTLALLTPSTPVIVRMETLRRAAIYASGDPAIAKDLLTSLFDRARAKGGDSLAVFDAGYLAETYRQLGPIASALPPLVQGLDGYALVKKSLTARGHDPAIEFAAAMMTADGRKAGWAEHVREAKAGAKSDVLLAKNIATLEQ